MARDQFAGEKASIHKGNVADRIFHDLRDGIVLGRFAPGSKLPTERDLARHYDVSAPTVREAIRGLSLIGLLDVRHGSGTYVTANSDALISLSLSTLIQLRKLGVVEILSVLGVLNELAASQAATVATAEDRKALEAALEAFASVKSVPESAQAVLAFHSAMVAAAHNPLLTSLCGFLIQLQTELALELAGSSTTAWRKIFAKLHPSRVKLVKSIIAGDASAARKAADAFHALATQTISSLPRAQEVRLTDPRLGDFLSSLIERMGRS
ncbi:FadR/GntR family transcriptional regulator [Chelatococcus asaccharovorans]|uniref:GntR family transcriptional repressor for pyruvate dehydrogenase complex n=1 Tax=Chelatococcus asaccharovorans TaxID=28210 RepID=A0A2V3UUK1_9HYPH|nr:GntR family transcriptional regulator [Chelatococcus asaccharovorans]MBS7701893.1 FadR family transcriptional regulator [Chelatococcus asaccharovorans]PXW64398.1 GntR family transcriptional repressor for pyruvate dehydrogenase complex [Chelatococcus asaccharovorans]